MVMSPTGSSTQGPPLLPSTSKPTQELPGMYVHNNSEAQVSKEG